LVDAEEIASIIGRELSMKLEFKTSSLEDDAKKITEVGYTDEAGPDFFHLLTLYARNEAAICTDDGEKLLGRKLTPIEDTINAHRSKIRHASRSYSFTGRSSFEMEWVDSPRT